jgi:hypothetical protein
MQYQKNDGGILVPESKIGGHGVYKGQIIKGGHFVKGVWEPGRDIVDEFEFSNLVTNEGLNHMLNVTLQAATQVASWYLGVFEGNYTPLATDTGANITANSTESTAYASATRPAFVDVAATAQVITNSASRASFVFNATKTIYGAFLHSNSAKSSTTGTCFSAARFGASKAVVNLDELLLTYSFTASSL